MTSPFDQPFPTREEQYALFAKAKAGDDDAYKALVESHLPLVARLAGAFPDLIPFQDRFQAGAAGLSVAVGKFDPGTGNLLSSYAMPAIRRHIREAIRKALNLKEPDARKWLPIKRASDRIWLEESREPSSEDLAAATGLSVEEVEYQIRCRNLDHMLREAAAPEPPDVEDLPAPREQRPDELAARNDAVTRTTECLARLPEAERRAVILFHGWTGEDYHTLPETAALMGVTLNEAIKLKNLGVQRLKLLFNGR